MNRERILKILLVLVGLLFLAGIYPLAVSLWHGYRADYGDDMMLSIYVTLGIFLLLAARKPAEHGSLIAFTAWSSFAHAAVMMVLGIHNPRERAELFAADTVLVLIGLALLFLMPAKLSAERTSPVGA